MAELRLMLIAPSLRDGEDLPGFAEAVAAAPFAAVVLRVADPADERATLKVLKPLVEQAQAVGAAVLIEGAPDLVGKSGADGAHALGERQTREAVERFKPEKIVGTGGLRTRDAAMTVGESGADYVLFGDPGKGGESPPLEALIERLEWWAEIFVTPCVGQADSLAAVGPIAEAGADFVALGSFVWTHPEGAAAAVRAALAALPAEAPAR